MGGVHPARNTRERITTFIQEVLIMAQKVTGYIKLQIPAAKATASPPVGPALGQQDVYKRQGWSAGAGEAFTGA